MSDLPVDELLRATALTNGSISLCRVNGSRWRAVVNHIRNGEAHPLEHMVHPFDDWQEDPVDALRVALVEDDRRCRDLQRRYEAARKMGDRPPFGRIAESRIHTTSGVDPDFDALDPLEDILG